MCQDHTLAENTVIKIANNKNFGIKNIVLSESSDSLSGILKNAIEDAVYEKCELIELLILLNDSSCQHGFETAMKEGFVFAGIIPGSENGDYIMMEMLMGTNCKYDKLETVGAYEELKNDLIAIAERRDNE